MRVSFLLALHLALLCGFLDAAPPPTLRPQRAGSDGRVHAIPQRPRPPHVVSPPLHHPSPPQYWQPPQQANAHPSLPHPPQPPANFGQLPRLELPHGWSLPIQSIQEHDGLVYVYGVPPFPTMAPPLLRIYTSTLYVASGTDPRNSRPQMEEYLRRGYYFAEYRGPPSPYAYPAPSRQPRKQSHASGSSYPHSPQQYQTSTDEERSEMDANSFNPIARAAEWQKVITEARAAAAAGRRAAEKQRAKDVQRSHRERVRELKRKVVPKRDHPATPIHSLEAVAEEETEAEKREQEERVKEILPLVSETMDSQLTEQREMETPKTAAPSASTTESEEFGLFRSGSGSLELDVDSFTPVSPSSPVETAIIEAVLDDAASETTPTAGQEKTKEHIPVVDNISTRKGSFIVTNSPIFPMPRKESKKKAAVVAQQEAGEDVSEEDPAEVQRRLEAFKLKKKERKLKRKSSGRPIPPKKLQSPKSPVGFAISHEETTRPFEVVAEQESMEDTNSALEPSLEDAHRGMSPSSSEPLEIPKSPETNVVMESEEPGSFAETEFFSASSGGQTSTLTELLREEEEEEKQATNQEDRISDNDHREEEGQPAQESTDLPEVQTSSPTAQQQELNQSWTPVQPNDDQEVLSVSMEQQPATSESCTAITAQQCSSFDLLVRQYKSMVGAGWERLRVAQDVRDDINEFVRSISIPGERREANKLRKKFFKKLRQRSLQLDKAVERVQSWMEGEQYICSVVLARMLNACASEEASIQQLWSAYRDMSMLQEGLHHVRRFQGRMKQEYFDMPFDEAQFMADYMALQRSRAEMTVISPEGEERTIMFV